MEKIESLSSEDIVARNIEKLRQLFPTAFSEGRLITEELLAILGEYTEKEVEYYHMDWAGKTRARMEANKVSTGTLRPAPEESKHWEDTGNIFIEGDNLEVLKLLQKSYSNKVKMIYIDPPYNTGKDFVYKDNYHDNLKNYLELSGQADESGRKFSTNTESDGRYHSNWLNMMYPRLMLARNLLTEEGVIFISIDDNEQANLKKLCDEIFGEENFVANAIWERAYSPVNLKKHFSENHDYIICFSKNIQKAINNGLKRRDSADDRYKNPDNDPRGPWKSSDLSVGPIIKEKVYKIITPGGREVWPPSGYCWRLSKDRLKEFIEDNRIWFGEDGNNVPSIKRFLSEVKQTVTPMTIWKYEEVGHSQSAAQSLKKLFDGKDYFDYPKPVGLIKRTAELYSNKDDIVLDFFAGSGTTAHAVMALNMEDGGNRKCISVQLPEPTEETSEAYKAGYFTIAEIAKERIRRAGELIFTGEEEKKEKLKEQLEKMIGRAILQITESDSIHATRYRLPEGTIIDEAAEDLLEELNEADARIRSLDTGFRVFKLDASNLHSWDPATDKFETQLDELFATGADHIKSDRTESDILYEILLKFGLELTVPILEKTLHGQTIYNIGYGTLYICLGENIHVEIARGIGEWQKEFPDSEPTVIFRDSGFPDDAAKTNTVQMLKQYGIDKVSSI